MLTLDTATDADADAAAAAAPNNSVGDSNEEEEVDGLRIIEISNEVGVLKIIEPFWSCDPECQGGGGTGSFCWEGSIILAKFLCQEFLVKKQAQPATRRQEQQQDDNNNNVDFSGIHQSQRTRRRRFLELGAGCSAMPTLTASRLRYFDECIATDGGDFEIENNLHDLRRNIEGNFRDGDTPIQVHHLDWQIFLSMTKRQKEEKEETVLPSEAMKTTLTRASAAATAAIITTTTGDDHGPINNDPCFDCICASEVVYEPESVDALLATLYHLSTCTTIILLYHTVRVSAASHKLWDKLPNFFDWQRVMMVEDEHQECGATNPTTTTSRRAGRQQSPLQTAGIFRLTKKQ